MPINDIIEEFERFVIKLWDMGFMWWGTAILSVIIILIVILMIILPIFQNKSENISPYQWIGQITYINIFNDSINDMTINSSNQTYGSAPISNYTIIQIGKTNCLYNRSKYPSFVECHNI